MADRPPLRVLDAYTIGGDDVKAANTWDQPDRVKPLRAQAVIDEDGVLRVTTPAPGLTVVRAELTP